MRFVIQRVQHASVTVDGDVIGKIGRGYMVLIGCCNADDEAIADKMVEKMIKLRINEDAEGKTNLSLADVDGGLLLVSQFTLLANYRHGNRPDFLESAKPEVANQLYEYFKKLLAGEIRHVGAGIFGAHMQVSLVNDGPVTIVMDSEVLKKKK
jgi:D-tyrosyl-tRNA(Tyr) deacylase